MPHFYFDTHDGDRMLVDDSGYALPDQQEARKAAISLLPDIASDVLPDGDTRVMAVFVHDERRRPIFKATLELHGEWLDDSPGS